MRGEGKHTSLPKVYIDKGNPGILRLKEDPTVGFLVGMRASIIAKAINAYDALMEEHRDGECYCLDPEEAMGRNPCPWCKVEAIAKSEPR